MKEIFSACEKMNEMNRNLENKKGNYIIIIIINILQ